MEGEDVGSLADGVFVGVLVGKVEEGVGALVDGALVVEGVGGRLVGASVGVAVGRAVGRTVGRTVGASVEGAERVTREMSSHMAIAIPFPSINRLTTRVLTGLAGVKVKE